LHQGLVGFIVLDYHGLDVLSQFCLFPNWCKVFYSHRKPHCGLPLGHLCMCFPSLGIGLLLHFAISIFFPTMHVSC
jgi:hypothetical protein